LKLSVGAFIKIIVFIGKIVEACGSCAAQLYGSGWWRTSMGTTLFHWYLFDFNKNGKIIELGMVQKNLFTIRKVENETYCFR
jgi:hypothetical protein